MCRSNAVDLTQGTCEARTLALPSPPPLVLLLASLTSKYNTLMALRVQREHLESNGVFALVGAAPQARRSMAQGLARQFPGALRELDCWNTAALAARLRDLADERARAYAQPHAEHPERPWVRAVLAYHAVMRQAMHLRNMARARHLAGAPLTARGQRFLAWHAASVSKQAQEVDAAVLAPFAPGSRRAMVGLVCEEVATTLGCAPDAVRRWVFG